MRTHFDLDPGLIYLNAGTHSICPRVVSEAAARYRREFERNPTAALFDVWERLWEIQLGLAEFLNARPGDLFLRTNVTQALNAFILGIPIPAKGGEILVTDLEYGAIVNLCRFRAEREGRTLRVLKLPSTPAQLKNLIEESLVQMILAELRPDTRMLLLSHVMTSNGLTIPLQALARETRRLGVLLAVDGAHGPGALPLDFSKFEDVDFYGGNLHKWVMGPKGTAFGWVAPRHHEALVPLEAGWTTFEYPVPFRKFGGGDRFVGKMMISSCHDFSSFLALRETFAFWKERGARAIYKRLGELQAHTRSEAARLLPWPSLSAKEGPLSGPLMSYELPPELARLGYDWMFQLLEKHGLQVSVPPITGRHCLRLSPHIHNSEEEITRGIELLARA